MESIYFPGMLKKNLWGEGSGALQTIAAGKARNTPCLPLALR
jgi:hypothetical protein